MRWDIFGRKKIDELLQNYYDLKINQTTIQNSITELSDKFDRLTTELKKIQQVTEIPLVKPIIRDAERASKKEKKDKLEPDTINNLWKN